MKNIINNCNTPNRRDSVSKGKLYGVAIGTPFKDLPLDVLDDFYYTHKKF